MFCLHRGYFHRAKNDRDKRESFKVKYFLLDKNSPYVKAADLSGSSSASSNNNANGGSAGGSNNSIEAIPVLTAESAAATASTNTATATKPPSPLHRTYSVDRARGEQLGVIHSASISHLSIRIQTEAGEYLNLTVSPFSD